jgi:hypothetical protein
MGLYYPVPAFYSVVGRCRGNIQEEKRIKRGNNNLFPCFSPRLSGISFIYPPYWTTGELNWWLLKKFLHAQRPFQMACLSTLITFQATIHKHVIHKCLTPPSKFSLISVECRRSVMTKSTLELKYATRLTCQFFGRLSDYSRNISNFNKIFALVLEVAISDSLMLYRFLSATQIWFLELNYTINSTVRL